MPTNQLAYTVGWSLGVWAYNLYRITRLQKDKCDDAKKNDVLIDEKCQIYGPQDCSAKNVRNRHVGRAWLCLQLLGLRVS